MTDNANPEHKQDTVDTPWPTQAMVTPEDFRSVEYNAIVRDLNTAFDHHLHNEFMKAARVHRSVEPAFSVYRLLGSVCGLHFRVEDRSQVFGAMMSFGNSRTSIPEDWLGEQNDYFYEILNEIEHPALRARLADIVWLNDRKKGQAASVAIAAYCDCVQKLADRTFEARFRDQNNVSMEEVDLIERASKIHYKTKKRLSPVEPHIADLLKSLYRRALENTEIAPLNRLSNLLDRFSLISWLLTWKKRPLRPGNITKSTPSRSRNFGIWRLKLMRGQNDRINNADVSLKASSRPSGWHRKLAPRREQYTGIVRQSGSFGIFQVLKCAARSLEAKCGCFKRRHSMRWA